MKKRTAIITICGLGIIIAACLIGVMALLIKRINNVEIETPQSVVPVALDTSPEPTSEPILTEESEEVVEPMVDHTERLAYLGDYIAGVTVANGKPKNDIVGFEEVFGVLPEEIAYSLEVLLRPYVTSMHPTSQELPKYYTGDEEWAFDDDFGFPGQVVRVGNAYYLFYYNPDIVNADKVIKNGFPATSYGYIQPIEDDLSSNQLFIDLPEDEAYRVLSALIDGEELPQYDDYYLVYQKVFSRLGYFPDDIEVKAYKVNQGLTDTFIEVYLTEDKYYTILSQSSRYQEILETSLLRYTSVEEEPEPTVEPSSDEESFLISDFSKYALVQYLWDETEPNLWDAVLRTSSKDERGNYVPQEVQYMLQYALERYGIDNCEFIGETGYVNGYPVTDKNVFAIQLKTDESSTTDYYISIAKLSKLITIYPANAVPKE